MLPSTFDLLAIYLVHIDYRINPDDDRQLQRRSIGGSSWSRVCEFNGYHILDLLTAPNGRDIEVYTDRYVYIREYSGGIRKR